MAIKRSFLRAFVVLKRTAALWSKKNAFQLSGALAFYTLISMAPLLLILVTLLGWVFGDETARREVMAVLAELVGTEAAGEVETAVQRARIEDAGPLPTLLGLGALLLGATTVFAQLQSALNDMWDVAARPSRSGILVFVVSRILSLGLVLIIGFLLLLSFVVTAAITALLRYAGGWIPVPALLVSAVDLVLSVLVATLLFATIFKVLPDVRLEWRDMWKGASLTAVLFVLGQYLISLYLTRTAPGSTYGAAGSIVLVLFWVYYSSLILFYGAAFIRVTIWSRAATIVPRRSAVRVHTEIVEDEVGGSAT